MLTIRQPVFFQTTATAESKKAYIAFVLVRCVFCRKKFKKPSAKQLTKYSEESIMSE